MLRKRQRWLELFLLSGLIILDVRCNARLPSTPTKPLTLNIYTVSLSGEGVAEGHSINIYAAVGNAEGSETVSWSATLGSISPGTGLGGPDSAVYTAPDTQPSPHNVTVTAKATDSAGNTATDTLTLTVTRYITLGINLPNDEIYSDFGSAVTLTMTCSRCQVGDILNIENGFSGFPDQTLVLTDPAAVSSWPQTFDHTGPLYQPTATQFWVTGTDGSRSAALWVAFTGSENVAVQDPATGEMYYAYSGDGTEGSAAILKFTTDGINGTPDGSYPNAAGGGSGAIALDGQMIYLTQPKPLTSGANGVATFDTTDGTNGLIPISDGEPLAIDANGGLVCVTIPTGGDSPNSADAVDCHDSNGTFAITGIPSGSQPAAIKVVDSSHLVVYGRGDQTLRWFTLSGSSATAAGALQLTDFTATDANYWNNYPATGGWYLALVNGTLGVMGQVVNADGTVSQKLALVDNTAQTLKQYIDLPDGTIRIAPDPTNNAITVEYLYNSYPVFSLIYFQIGYGRVYADTGNASILSSSVPGAVPGPGFLVTDDGSKIATFGRGQLQFETNQ